MSQRVSRETRPYGEVNAEKIDDLAERERELIERIQRKEQPETAERKDKQRWFRR